MKKFRNVITVLLLVVAMIVGTDTISTGAMQSLADNEWDAEIELVDENPEIAQELRDKRDNGVAEIESLREENVKHFQLADGSYQAVAYAGAVHRKNTDGKWTDIDNRLLLDGPDMLTTNDGYFTFALSADAEQMFALNDGKHSVSFGFVDLPLNSVNAEVINHDAKATAVDRLKDEEKLETLKQVDNTTKVYYRNVLDGISLEYILDGNSVKENVILNGPTDIAKHTYRMRLDGLYAKTMGEGEILLVDFAGEQVYYLTAPFMYDSAGELCHNVRYEMEQIEEFEYLLSVVLDRKWLEDEKRVYPVTVDPSVNSGSVYYDTYVNSSSPSTNYGGGTQLWVGNGNITYIRIPMPTLPTYADITSASFTTRYHYNISTGSMTVGVYQCLQSWAEGSLTWNSASTNTNMGLSSTRTSTGIASASSTITASNPGHLTFSVTELVKKWYAGVANYGVGLKYESGTNLSVIFESYESSSSYRSSYTINYTIITPPVQNGTYFIKNCQLGNYLQIDNNDASNNYATNDAILELFGFDGNAYQKWTLTYLHNGYYKIISSKSGKAISVKSSQENTGNVSLRQQTYSGDPR